jgi:hypothetical protein
MADKRRNRTITGRTLLVAAAVGAVASIPLRIVDPTDFSWWFVVGCSVGVVFAYAALLRRDRWDERNACIALAGICVAATLVTDSLFFLGGVVAILGIYLVVLERAASKESGETPPPR